MRGRTLGDFHHVCRGDTACLDGEEQSAGCAQGRANDVAFRMHPKLNGYRVFLCGAPQMVKSASKTAHLAGASLADIYSDPFEFAAPSL